MGGGGGGGEGQLVVLLLSVTIFSHRTKKPHQNTSDINSLSCFFSTTSQSQIKDYCESHPNEKNWMCGPLFFMIEIVRSAVQSFRILSLSDVILPSLFPEAGSALPRLQIVTRNVAKTTSINFTRLRSSAASVVVSCKIPILATRVRFPGGAHFIVISFLCFPMFWSDSCPSLSGQFLFCIFDFNFFSCFRPLGLNFWKRGMNWKGEI